MSESGKPIRFLCDQNFRQRIVVQLRRKQPDMDIQTAVEAGILGLKDPQVLAYAAEQDRILLSHDVRTMPQHFDAFLAEERHSPGVLLLAQEMPIGQAIETVQFVWGANWPEEWHDLCIRLP